MSQQNKTTLQAAINTQLADNTSGDISAADVRDNMINMTDSLVFNEGTGQTITGGLTVTGGITGSFQGTATTASYATTASFVQSAQTSSYVLNSISSSFASTASFVRTAQTASFVVTAQTASYVLNAVSASFASTASYIPVAQTLVDANLPLILINGNSLVKDQYDSITYNPLNNLLTVVANTDFTGPITSLSSISSTGGFTGSLQGTSSYANQALSASWAPSTGGSSFPYTGSAGISGSLVLDGTLRQGQSTQTTGNYSRAYGNSSIASGDYSHAEGNSTEAIGQSSHAEGQFTIAQGNGSHSEGVSTTSVGPFSHAEGIGTVASGSFQHVGGRYNTQGDTTSLFIIGNGNIDTEARSDAFKVRMSGSIVLPTTSSGQPSWTGTNGEIIAGTAAGGAKVLWVYLGGTWLTSSLGI
jgi:hypothetical protein